MFSVILSGPSTHTLPIAVYSMMNFEDIVWEQVAGAAVVVTIPIIILVLLIQRHIVTGLTLGAVKA